VTGFLGGNANSADRRLLAGRCRCTGITMGASGRVPSAR
jgi:hypothetical protein